jgi:hypothetical protein
VASILQVANDNKIENTIILKPIETSGKIATFMPALAELG